MIINLIKGNDHMIKQWFIIDYDHDLSNFKNMIIKFLIPNLNYNFHGVSNFHDVANFKFIIDYEHDDRQP